ncbi:MAG: hypothetical protein KH295_04090 [Clostridiaceae bacterium]|nr:hypothetical protein [Clostridiaceae bacterium]
MDNVLHAPEGDIHYHIYIPDSYDGSESYALYLTLPGYEGLYFQGAGQNLYSENFAFAALQYNDKMIVAAPQLNDWGKTELRWENRQINTRYIRQEVIGRDGKNVVYHRLLQRPGTGDCAVGTAARRTGSCHRP